MSKPARDTRQQRVRAALQTAFSQLLQERTYESITVGDITRRAGVGRTTFYRHFAAKADLVIAMHEHVYEDIGALLPYELMASEGVPPTLTALFERLEGYNRSRMLLLMTLGRDVDVIMKGLDDIITQQFAAGLTRAFKPHELRVPADIVARGMAGALSWVQRMAFYRQMNLSATELAAYTATMLRGLLRESLLSLHALNDETSP